MQTGSRFLSTTSISNRNVDWTNSITGNLISQLSIRPCLQGGIWGTALDFIEAHAYGEMCVDVFAKTTLKHESNGFDASPDTSSSMSRATVKLDEILPSTFKTCEVSASTKHDTRLSSKLTSMNPFWRLICCRGELG